MRDPMNSTRPLDRAACRRVEAICRKRLGCLPQAAAWLALVSVILWACAIAARADGPPQHGPLDCDPVCVVDYCRARCDGPGERTDAERRECRRQCVPYVTSEGCWPCREGDK